MSVEVEVVAVVWLDAAHQTGPIGEKEFSGLKPIHTAGFVARETTDVLSLAMDYHAEDNEWRDVRHIPKVHILERKQWKAKLVPGPPEGE